MHLYPAMLSNGYNYLFTDEQDKEFAEQLIRFVVLGVVPETTPALWQDVEIYIRFKKRDVWSLSEERIMNAMKAISVYRLKYITKHLKKSEIVNVLNELFSQERGGKQNKTLMELFGKKLHAPVDALFLMQEKIVVDTDQVENFNQIFEYPGWVEFTPAANEAIFEKILKDKLSDEQIDYFLGASDDMAKYDRWFEVAKHILTTTKNSHTFWTAGDVLGIIWKAIPEDEKSQKWFRDQIFEIFWSRVGSVWPMKNQNLINFDANEEARILRDSINWLETLSDIKERLPELGEDYELDKRKTPEEDFIWGEGALLGKINAKNKSVDEMMGQFFDLVEVACSESNVERLRQIAEKDLIPAVRETGENVDMEKVMGLIERAIRYAEKSVRNLKRESRVMGKMIGSKI